MAMALDEPDDGLPSAKKNGRATALAIESPDVLDGAPTSGSVLPPTTHATSRPSSRQGPRPLSRAGSKAVSRQGSAAPPAIIETKESFTDVFAAVSAEDTSRAGSLKPTGRASSRASSRAGSRAPSLQPFARGSSHEPSARPVSRARSKTPNAVLPSFEEELDEDAMPSFERQESNAMTFA